MVKTRSPTYPAIGLKEALEKVTAIFNQNFQAPIPRSVAAELMGYGGLNGKSLGVLAALSKYGLLEGRGDDTRVSDLAVRIIAHAPGMTERSQAILEAASRPELFKEIDARYQGGKASDAAIRAYLITQKFIPAAADSVVRTYRETKNFVQAEAIIERQVTPFTEENNENIPLHSDVASTPILSKNSLGEGDLQDDPYEISISGNSKSGKIISGRFSFRDQRSVDDLIGILNAMKLQLPNSRDENGS